MSGGDLADPEVADRLAGRREARVRGAGHFCGERRSVASRREVRSQRLSAERWRTDASVPIWIPSSSPTRAVAASDAAGGRVVIVSSTAGQRGEAYHADYAATKGALISLTKSLAIECAPDITVNCVAPGWVDTDMSAPRSPRITGNESRNHSLRRIATAKMSPAPFSFSAVLSPATSPERC